VGGGAVSESEIQIILNELGHIKTDVAEIKQQVKLTNGRVSKLEIWRAWIAGMWLATVVIASIIWTIFTFVAG
jgi:hypothetical protein